VRDLGRAFTRAIPAACSGDPEWAKGAVGDYGTLVAELRVNAEGHLGSMEPMGKDPPKALVNVLRRTLPLLQAGTFAVQGGTVQAGTQTIELKATVTDEGAGDEATGARDNLAFSYGGGHGKASFTQSGGRRVDISVRVIKVEVTP
jgi:hypothetical protein